MPKANRPNAETIWDAILAIQTGTSSAEVAAKVGVAVSTLKTWQKKYGESSLEEIKLILDPKDSRYIAAMRRLFNEHYTTNSDGFVWERSELDRFAKEAGLESVKNLGDNIYSIRHGREDLPEEIRALAPKGRHWLLLPNGKSSYRFALTDRAFLDPDLSLRPIKVPD